MTSNIKNIKMKKKGGGYRLQRVQVLRSGKYKFLKNITKKSKASTRSKPRSTKTATRSTRKTTKKGKVRTMAKRKYYRMRKPTAQIKGAIGKFQKKHPYVSAAASAVVIGATLDGAVEAATGSSASRHAGLGPAQLNKIPGWEKLRALSAGVLRAILRR